MECLYRPSHWRQYRNPSPFFSSAAGGRPQRPHPAAAQPAMPRRRGMVSIPVVDGSEDRNRQPLKVPRATAASKLSEHEAAVRVQRSFRGHLVRRALAAVRALDGEVSDIEARVRESIGRVATDERERVRVGEMVMRVLLRLDGVRGVRDHRKKVVRRAVKLQEMIDSLAAGGGTEDVGTGEDQAAEGWRGGEEVVRGEDIAVGKTSDVTVEDEDARDYSEEGCSLSSGSDSGGSSETGTEAIEEAEAVEKVKDIKNDPRPLEDVSHEFDAEESVSKPDSMEETPDLSIVLVNHIMEDEGSVTKPDAMAETQVAHTSIDRSDEAMEDAWAAETRNGNDKRSAAIGSSVENAPEPEEQAFSDFIVVDNPKSPPTEAPTTSSDEKSPEPAPLKTVPSTLPCPTLSLAPGPVEVAAGRMAQENERLRGIIEELLEQSALQSRLMFQLSRRVESLEEKVEKMGKKKRKHAGDTGAAAAMGKKN